LYAEKSAWDGLMTTDSRQSRIDVWWSDDASGKLMLLFAYLMTRSEPWDGTTLRVLVFRYNSLSTSARELAMQEILQEARIGAEVVFVESKDDKVIIDASTQSTFVFLPFRFHGDLIQLPVDVRAEDLLQKLPPSVMILAAEDIDLSAEPEEGIAAQLAEAKDLLEKKEKLVETAEKEASEASQFADSVKEKLDKALAKQITDTDEELISKLKSDRDKAIKAAEKARRRAFKARIKAEDIQKQIEEQNLSSEIGEG
jgi:hypothetical protein